jgi:nucleotidyltransferase substrate binding protein (TIGR01987 family)
MSKDTSWKKSYKNYKQALATLKNGVEIAETRKLTNPEKQDTIENFDQTIALAWDVMKDYLADQGIIGINESGDAVRYAFNNNLIEDRQVWMDMLKEHKLASKSNDEKTADDLLDSIVHTYYSLFNVLAERIDELEE